MRYIRPERKYVVDSGASLHIIGWRHTTKSERQTARKTSRIYHIQTASGQIQAEWECKVIIEDLQLSVWAVMTDGDTPAILSLGRLCHEEGFSYEWPEGEVPMLIKDGIQYVCDTENFVPMVHLGRHREEEACASEEIPILDDESTDAGGDSQRVSESEEAEEQDSNESEECKEDDEADDEEVDTDYISPPSVPVEDASKPPMDTSAVRRARRRKKPKLV